MFMALLDVTIVNIAMPAIITDLDATVSQVSWVLNAYNLVLAVFFLSMGRVADRYGQKRVFIFGLVTFTLFSLLCGFAPNIEWLIAFRAGQGLGGAALLTISLAIVLGAFPKRQQGTAVGIWGALGTVAAAVGPMLGGVLVTYGHWSWIFFVNVPIGIVAVIVCARIIPRGERKEKVEGGIDIPGIVISGVGLFCLTLALVEGNTWGWTSATIIALFVAAVVSFPLFMWWETTTSSPMFPVSLLRIRSFTAANTAVMFVGLAMGGDVPHARPLPRVGARLHGAARRRGDDDHADPRADRRAQRRPPERPHRAPLPGRRRRGVLRRRPRAAGAARRRHARSGT